METYPRDPSGHTNLSRYGESVFNASTTSGWTFTNNVAMADGRLPVSFYQGGNSGFLRGTVTCNRAPVTPAVTRAWSMENGIACGIQGFSAAATMGVGTYTFATLAAGQCNAPSQPYQIRVTAECNGVTTTKTQYTNVARSWSDSVGAWHGTTLNFAFP
jgi:hypothetical protein